MTKSDFFVPGKLSIVLDGQAGSGGKGKLGSYIADREAGNFQFVCNTFSCQASHWVHDKNTGIDVCYRQLNSCSHKHHLFEKMYIGQGAVISLDAFREEVKLTKIPYEKIGISPLTVIRQPLDKAYERGEQGFDGEIYQERHDGTLKFGSTTSGAGAARARKILRRPNTLLARDVAELQPFICDVQGEILERLAKGQAGLLETSQGFQLSYGLANMYPHSTSRNISVAATLDDMFLPISVVGNICLNFRTFPIRIASKKYICNAGPEKGAFLTREQVQSGNYTYDIIDSHSGEGYDDQEEISAEYIEETHNVQIEEIAKMTSYTKLPRRFFTFSQKNLDEAITYNQIPGKIFISINFANWVDGTLDGKTDTITPAFKERLDKNVYPTISKYANVELRYIGTGKYSEDLIEIEAAK